MNDYISREDALECVTYDVEYTTEQIKGLPSADVVQVVRCRDCREFAKTSHWCESFDNPTGEDDFCSYGERKE